MIKVDTRQLQRFEEHLAKYAKKALPYAIKNGLNSTAFEARKEWAEKQLPAAFTLRNKWTQKSIRVEKAGGRSIEQMESRVGSVLPYMKEQEEGFTQHRQGKHGVALPTTAAAGQGKKARKRTRAVRRANYLNALQVSRRVSGIRGIRQRRNAVAISTALKRGEDVVLLELGGRRKGLFRLEGTKRGMRVRMLYDLSRPSVSTKPHQTLEPTLAAIRPRLASIWQKALHDELKRHRVLWYGM